MQETVPLGTGWFETSQPAAELSLISAESGTAGGTAFLEGRCPAADSTWCYLRGVIFHSHAGVCCFQPADATAIFPSWGIAI